MQTEGYTKNESGNPRGGTPHAPHPSRDAGNPSEAQRGTARQASRADIKGWRGANGWSETLDWKRSETEVRPCHILMFWPGPKIPRQGPLVVRRPTNQDSISGNLIPVVGPAGSGA